VLANSEAFTKPDYSWIVGNPEVDRVYILTWRKKIGFSQVTLFKNVGF
jgi:hypothetical protein